MPAIYAHTFKRHAQKHLFCVHTPIPPPLHPLLPLPPPLQHTGEDGCHPDAHVSGSEGGG
jgi:hypothetical protein